LANFGTAKFSGAEATINGTTGAIDNASWQNTSIDMVSRSGTIIDQTSGLTDTTTPPITSSFSVTYTGSGGGGRGGHGHGPNDAVVFVVPGQPDFQAPATPEAIPSPTAESLGASAGQDLIRPAPAADAFFAQVHERWSTSELKTGWGALQSDITDEALRSDIMGSDEFHQTL
jgi:hypothetical protein